MALRNDGTMRQDGSFLATAQQLAQPPARDRSAEAGGLIKAAHIAPAEIGTAARQVQDQGGDVPQDDRVRAVARVLGFQHAGSTFSCAIIAALST